MRSTKVFITFLCSILIFTGCNTNGNTREVTSMNSLEAYIHENYMFVDVVQSTTDQSDTAKIFRAANHTIESVSGDIQANFKPEQVSEVEKNRQALVFPSHFVILTKDEDNPNDVLIELSTYGFVRDNYSPNFFNGLFLLWMLDDVLDVDDWHKKRKNKYQGYGTSGGIYKGVPKTSPSIRGSSSNNRGGGPGTGK